MLTTEYPHKWECAPDKQNANIAALCETHNTHIRLELQIRHSLRSPIFSCRPLQWLNICHLYVCLSGMKKEWPKMKVSMADVVQHETPGSGSHGYLFCN